MISSGFTTPYRKVLTVNEFSCSDPSRIPACGRQELRDRYTGNPIFLPPSPVSDDDDLLSLDFTSMVPTPPAEPEVVAQPAPVAPVSNEMSALSLVPREDLAPPAAPTTAPGVEPAAALPVSVPAARPLPACLLEAAELHANGDEVQASRCLEAGVKRGRTLGDDEERVWVALFQQLQVLGKQSAFDTLALAYARRFEQSPPAWVQPAADTDPESSGIPGIVLTGTLNSGIGESLKQLMKLAHAANVVSLDVGSLTDADNDGGTLIMRALSALKKAKKTCLFISPRALADVLSAKLPVGQKGHEPLWLLMLELYQQAGDQAVFEDAAVNYAVTFEVSPPSYEPPGPAAGPVSPAPKPAAVAAKSEGLALRGRLLGDQSPMFDAVAKASAKGGDLSIDATALTRIDEAATKKLKTVLEPLKIAGVSVRLWGLSQLVAVYLGHHGLAEVARIETRKV